MLIRQSQTHSVGPLHRAPGFVECDSDSSVTLLRGEISFTLQVERVEIMISNYFADFIFLCDLILNFRTTHLDEEGE